MFNRNKKSVGIEINDNLIRVLELVFKKDEWRVIGANEIRLAPGVVEFGQIKDRKTLAKSLKKALFEAQPKSIKNRTIHFALPDELLKTHVFKTELSIGKGIKQAVLKEFQKINVRGSDVDFAFRVINTKTGPGYNQISSVVLISAEKSGLFHWQDFFKSMGMKVEFFDIGSLSTYRGFFEERQNSNIGLLALDDRRTKLSLFSEYGLEYETDWPIGLSMIASDFKGSYEPAQDFFEERGVDIGERSEELSSLALDIKKALNKAAEHKINEENRISGANLIVKKLIVCGEGGNIPGIHDYLSSLIPGIEFMSKDVRGFADDSGVVYAQVLGLALRPFENNWDKSDPFLSCNNNAFGIMDSIKDGNHKLSNLFVFIKKLILIPLFLFMFAFGIWLLSGTLSNVVKEHKMLDDGSMPQSKVDDIGKPSGNQEPAQKEEESQPIINDPAVQKTPADEKPAVEEKETEKTEDVKKYLTVNNDIGRPLNVRKGAGTEFPIIGEAAEGSKQIFLEEKGNWVRIEWKDEASAWVHKDYIKKE